MEPIIKIRNLRKVYRIGSERVVALDNIDLDIAAGEICCILGTSGSGKSTLLNMLAGLERPTRGSVEILGTDIARASEKQLARFRREKIGFIFQSYNLLGSLNALENVALPLTFRRVPRRKRELAAKKMLKAVGLSKHIRHRPNQMSGGQQQRVGIARAYVTEPPVVFADEPTGNLDSKTTVEVMEMITAIARERKQTLIIVTHDREIADYADRILFLLDGRIESDTRVEHPQTPPAEPA
ncbi:MAG: ABC transporter ATP-binding protein [Clostridia bacterium]|nr:ABC transporter ATP-binding protein [Clostridia bacterium]